MKNTILYFGIDPSHYQLQPNDLLIHCPLIETIPRPLNDPLIQKCLHNFTSYTHILCTSRTTVAILHTFLSPSQFIEWRNKTTIAIGTGTASDLIKIGINSPIVCEDETAEGVISQLSSMQLKNSHIFWPHSSGARPLILNYLKKQTALFTTCELYDTHPKKIDTLPDLNIVNEVVFTSPSTVRAFRQFYGEIPSHLVIKTLGPITSKAVKNS